jgi:signal transduction histidine kinase
LRDHGHGVPESFRRRIFEKFAQADASDARQLGGTGLGLSIVKQIVLRLEGEVGFLDAPGGGTMFYVELPALASEASGRRGNGLEVRAHSDPDRLRRAAGALRAFARTGTA